MRIYLAGEKQYTRSAESAEAAGATVIRPGDYPYHLESYFYLRKKIRELEHYKEAGLTIFLDSGAFSMFTSGVEISLEQYAGFIHQHQQHFHVCSNLDDTSKNERKSYENQKALESLGCKVAPVFHAREDPRWLTKYIDEGYEYIFIGGMVPETTKWLEVWLDEMFDKYLANPDGTARVKLHGFGLTTLSLMWRYPWFSVDSTSWLMAGNFGSIYVDLPRPDGSYRDLTVSVSAESSGLRKLDAHINTYSPAARKEVLDRVEELGYDINKIQNHFSWRWHFNMQYFKRLLSRPPVTFKRTQRTLFA